VVPRPAELRADIVAAETAVQRFVREMGEGIQFLRGHRNVVLIGISWSLFLGAMLTSVVVAPSLSDKVFHAGAVGYGWLNAGWGTGAFLSALYAPLVIARLGSRRSIALSMGALAICMSVALPPHLAIAVAIFGIMGSGRHQRINEHQHHGTSSLRITWGVVNTFYFCWYSLQTSSFLVGRTQFNLVLDFDY
jgi:MFS family permease